MSYYIAGFPAFRLSLWFFPCRPMPSAPSRFSLMSPRKRCILIPKDTGAVTQDEFQRRAQWISSIERIVATKGQVLYEAHI